MLTYDIVCVSEIYEECNWHIPVHVPTPMCSDSFIVQVFIVYREENIKDVYILLYIDNAWCMKGVYEICINPEHAEYFKWTCPTSILRLSIINFRNISLNI
jgi:hypothetical protein